VFAPGLFDQHSVYRAPDVPSVVSAVATAYTSYGDDAVTDVVDVNPTKVLTPNTPLPPHASADSRMRTTLEALKPWPVNCREHDSVKVHCVAPTIGPDTWKGPTSNKDFESCAQHKCQLALAGPAVVVPRLNVSKGVKPTLTSKLPPVYPVAAAAAFAHVVPLATTFT
jgi:hypothetical protein